MCSDEFFLKHALVRTDDHKLLQDMKLTYGYGCHAGRPSSQFNQYRQLAKEGAVDLMG